jgi:hypothetical protein
VARDDKCGYLIVREWGGLTTWLHAVADAKGPPLKFPPAAGQDSDQTGAVALATIVMFQL